MKEKHVIKISFMNYKLKGTLEKGKYCFYKEDKSVIRKNYYTTEEALNILCNYIEKNLKISNYYDYENIIFKESITRKSLKMRCKRI